MGAVVRFGILGCAGIAKKNIRAMHMVENVEAYAIGSRSLEKATEFAIRTGMKEGSKVYGSYQEVVDDPNVDVVYIPLPTSLHLEWVQKAAAKGKHVLLEKPPAMSVEELDKILSACRTAGVQFMDGTMWMHNPRTEAMRNAIKASLGAVNKVNASFFFDGSDDFLATNIRLKPDLDGLGGLGDLGWYCIRAALWAYDFEPPTTVVAHPGFTKTDQGVLLSCGATLVWPGSRTAIFHCGFDSHYQQRLVIAGRKGLLWIDDHCIPNRADACQFNLNSTGGLAKDGTVVRTASKVVEVPLRVPQEAFMLEAFARLVRGVKDGTGSVDEHWFKIARTTQVVVNAVLESIESGTAVSL